MQKNAYEVELLPLEEGGGMLPNSPTKKPLTTQSVGDVAWQCSFLPLMSDKVRNNVVFRPLFALLYLSGASFVCFLLILSFTFTQRSDWTVELSAPKSRAFTIGAAMDTFSLQVTSVDGSGVEDVEVVARLVPISDVDLTVDIGLTQKETGTIRCLESMSFPKSASSARDLFCNPPLLNNRAITDADGNALFDMLTVTHGVLATYLLIVSVANNAELYKTVPLKLQAQLSELTIGALPPFFPDAVPIGGAWGLNVSFAWSIDALGVYAEAYTVVCGAIVPLDMQQPDDATPLVPEPLFDTPVVKAIFIANSVACADQFDVSNVTDALGVTQTILSATLEFTNVQVQGTNTPMMYLGISVLGALRPIPPLPSETMTGLTPAGVALSLTPVIDASMVVSAIVSVPLNATGVYDVVEGGSLPPITVTVTVGGRPVGSGKYVFLNVLLSHSPSSISGAVGVSAMLLPWVEPKKLLNDVAITDANGVAVFSAAFFSAAGACGLYDLKVVCDGADGVWARSNDVKSTWNVSTSVRSVTVGGFANVKETISSNWQSVPKVKVVGAGGVAVRGKCAVIVPLNDTMRELLPTVSSSLPSADDGTVFFRFVQTYATLPGVSAAPLNVVFAVMVDNVVFATFFKSFRVASVRDSVTCSWVRVRPVHPPSFVGPFYTGQVVVDLTAFSALGIAQPATSITVSPNAFSDYTTVGFGSEFSEGNVQIRSNTSGSYRYTWAVSEWATIGNVLRYGFSCDSQATNWNFFALARTRRITDVQSNAMSGDAGGHSVNVTLQVAQGQLLSAENPVTVSTKVLLRPSYTLSLAGMDDPVSNTATITQSAATVQVLLNISQASNAPSSRYLPPGVYVFGVVVDGEVLSTVSFYVLAPTGSLTLTQSAFGSVLPSTGELLASQPAVYFHGASGSCLLPEGAFVFMQLLVRLENDTEWIAVNPATDATQLRFGSVYDAQACSSADPTQVTNCAFAVAEFNLLTCVARFQSITIQNLAHGIDVSARYCFSVKGGGASQEACVNDTGVQTSRESLQYVINVDTSTVLGVPGQKIRSSISISGLDANGMMLQFPFVCLPFADGASGSVLVIPQSTQQQGGYRSSLDSSQGGQVLTIPAESLTVSLSAVDGNAPIVFYCSGGATDSTPLILSVNSNAQLLSEVIPFASSAAVGSVVESVVAASTSDGSPVAGVQVSVAVTSSTPTVVCVGYPCGLLHPLSVLTAQTDKNGFAIVYWIASAAATSKLTTVVATSESDTSDTAVQQSIFSQMNAVASVLGLPTQQTITTLVASNGDLQDFFTIWSSLLVSNSAVSSGISTQFLQTGTYLRGVGYNSCALLSLADVRDTLATMTGTPPAGDSTALQLERVVQVSNVAKNSSVLRLASVPTLSIPLSKSLVQSQFSGTVATGSAQIASVTLTGTSCPIVQFFDTNGTPIDGNPDIFIDVIPFGYSIGATVQTVQRISAASGSGFLLCPILIQSTDAGTFSLRASMQGGAPVVVSSSFAVSLQTPLTKTQLMQIISGMLVLIFAPMLTATVPHAKTLHVVGAVLFGGATVAGAWYARTALPSSEVAYYTAYCWYIFGISCCLAVTQLVVSLCQLVVQRLTPDSVVVNALVAAPRSQQQQLDMTKATRLRLALMDTDRAIKTLSYSMWLINERVTSAAQCKGRDEAVAKALTSFSNRMATRIDTICRSINARRGKEVFSVKGLDDKQQKRLLEAQATVGLNPRQLLQGGRPKFVYLQPELEPIYTPINFVIVASMSVALLITATFAIVSAFITAHGSLEQLVAGLPDLGVVSGLQGTDAVNCVTDTLVEMMQILVQYLMQKNPKLGKKAAPLLNNVRQLDPIGLMSSARVYFVKLAGGLQICFWIAGAIAFVVYLATLLLTWRSIPNLIRDVWRGTTHHSKCSGISKITPSILSLDVYIGLHCLQLAIGFVFTFVVVLLIVNIPIMFFIVVEPFRQFVLNAVLTAILASIVTTLVLMFVNKVLVAKFMCEGTFTVVRPELYALWHFAGLILGIFSALIKGIVRWVLSIVLVTLSFGRVELALYPEQFTSLDKTHAGFISVVKIDAMCNNPHYLVFSALLIANQLLKRAAHTQVFFKLHHISDFVNAEAPRLSAVVKNIVIAQIRSQAIWKQGKTQTNLKPDQETRIDLTHLNHANLDNNVRKNKITQRFWLAYILAVNPSLRPHRKHASAPHSNNLRPRQSESSNIESQSPKNTQPPAHSTNEPHPKTQSAEKDDDVML